MQFLEVLAGLSIIYIMIILFRLWHKRYFVPLYPTPQQIEITETTPLLQTNGHLTKEGWARQPLWTYDRALIKTNSLRIKEWDYYAIMSDNGQFCITATISDLGFGGLMAIAYIDMENKVAYQQDTIQFLTLGSLNLAASPNQDGTVKFHDKKLSLEFTKKGTERKLFLSAPHLEINGKSGFECEFTLSQPEDLESMSIATSWAEKRKAFYLNTKINCLKLMKGNVKIGSETKNLGENEAHAVLDWGRGFWTYANTWFWSSASGLLNGEEFGWNLGYGFTDRSPASENVIIYKRKAHKLQAVTFSKENDYMKPWTITGQNIELTFTPSVERSSKTDFLIIKSIQHQVFGQFSGTVTLEDGTVLQVEDFPGFAEEVYNRW